MSTQPRRIVVGYDGTVGARRALDAAAELLGYGSTLIVVSVEPRSDPGALVHAREHLLANLVSATYVRRVGEPADELVAAADELGADLVVVGRRSRAEHNGSAPGSVSADVVKRLACDVLVVG